MLTCLGERDGKSKSKRLLPSSSGCFTREARRHPARRVVKHLGGPGARQPLCAAREVQGTDKPEPQPRTGLHSNARLISHNKTLIFQCSGQRKEVTVCIAQISTSARSRTPFCSPLQVRDLLNRWQASFTAKTNLPEPEAASDTLSVLVQSWRPHSRVLSPIYRAKWHFRRSSTPDARENSCESVSQICQDP